MSYCTFFSDFFALITNNLGVYMANKKLGSEAKLQKYGIFFVIPFIVIYLIFQLWPTIYTVLLAFTVIKGFSQELTFIGLKNFV